MPSAALRPLSALFSGVVQVRNFLFDQGILKNQVHPVRIVSVGNLSAGGTGKTPFVAQLTRGLLAQQKKVCIVSRGYGGNYSAPAARVVAAGPESANSYGDEPVWFAKTLPVPVFVGRARNRAVELCLREERPQLIIADDAFQHRWLARDVDIVLIDATDSNLHLLPEGRYREPLSSLARAKYVVLTKTNLVSKDALADWKRQLSQCGFSLEKNNFFTSQFEAADLIPIAGDRTIPPIEDPVLLASGIARPQSFEKMASSIYKVAHHFVYPDHHPWSADDVQKIEALAREKKLKTLIVTEKDAVKMEGLQFSQLNVAVMPLRMTVVPEFPYDKLI